jgi:CBS domain-containing protein
MPIGDFCNREVVVADPRTSVLEGARLMRKHHVGNVVVIESSDCGRKPIGIVTDRDIVLEVVVKQLDPQTVTLGDIMVSNVAIAHAGEGVFDTIQFMRRRGIRRVPVVDGAGELVGIIALDDMIGLLAEELSEVSRAISHEQEQEAETRK